jgi:hypothetical protein
VLVGAEVKSRRQGGDLDATASDPPELQEVIATYYPTLYDANLVAGTDVAHALTERNDYIVAAIRTAEVLNLALMTSRQNKIKLTIIDHASDSRRESFRLITSQTEIGQWYDVEQSTVGAHLRAGKLANRIAKPNDP